MLSVGEFNFICYLIIVAAVTIVRTIVVILTLISTGLFLNRLIITAIAIEHALIIILAFFIEILILRDKVTWSCRRKVLCLRSVRHRWSGQLTSGSLGLRRCHAHCIPCLPFSSFSSRLSRCLPFSLLSFCLILLCFCRLYNGHIRLNRTTIRHSSSWLGRVSLILWSRISTRLTLTQWIAAIIFVICRLTRGLICRKKRLRALWGSIRFCLLTKWLGLGLRGRSTDWFRSCLDRGMAICRSGVSFRHHNTNINVSTLIVIFTFEFELNVFIDTKLDVI